jgi:hypothetical protein
VAEHSDGALQIEHARQRRRFFAQQFFFTHAKRDSLSWRKR